MPENTAPDAALSFSPEAVHLQRRIGDGWQETDHVRFDAADLRGELAGLRQRLEGAEGARPPVLLVIPEDQILYTRLKVSADSPAAMPAAVAQALDGLTPYAVEALAFDWLPAGPGEVHVAAVARQTLTEAEAFALRHGFAIRGFISDPDPERYPGEPNFTHPASVPFGKDASGKAVESTPSHDTTGGDAVAGVMPEPSGAKAASGRDMDGGDELATGPASDAAPSPEVADADEALPETKNGKDDRFAPAVVNPASLAASTDPSLVSAPAREVAERKVEALGGTGPTSADASLSEARDTEDNPVANSPDHSPAEAAEVAATVAETAEVDPCADAFPKADKPPAPSMATVDADPVITRIPPSVPYPPAPPVLIKTVAPLVATKSEPVKPQPETPLSARLTAKKSAAPAAALAAPKTIVRHGEAEDEPESDPVIPAVVARRLLGGRHGSLIGMVALLVVVMLLVALFAGGGRKDETTLAEAPAPVATETPAPAAAEAPVAAATESPTPVAVEAVEAAASPEVDDVAETDAALPEDVAAAPAGGGVTPDAATAPTVEAATPSMADQVQAAADDALGNALREALAMTPAQAAGQAASVEPVPVGTTPAVTATAVSLGSASSAPVSAPSSLASVPAQPVGDVTASAGAPAASPQAVSGSVPTASAPVAARPVPVAQLPAEASPSAVTPVPAAPRAGNATQGAAQPTAAPAPAPSASAPAAVTVPASQTASTLAPARPATKPARRPVVAAPASAPAQTQAVPRPTSAVTPAPAVPQASVAAGRPASRPAAAPSRAMPAPAPAVTPAPQLQRSIRPPSRPLRFGAVWPQAPAERFAADQTPQGLDPAAFAIPVRIAMMYLPEVTDAPRYAQARPVRKPGAGATAVDAALREAVTAPADRPGASASTARVAAASATTTSRSGRPARKPGSGASTPQADGAAVESAIAAAIQASTVPPRADPAPVPGALRSSALPPRRASMALAAPMTATPAGVVVPPMPATASGPDTTARIAAAAQASQDAAAAERRRLDDELQAQAEARIRARADADTQAEARARAQAEARARAQADAEERAARARGGSYRPAEVDDEPELASIGSGTTSQAVVQNATIRRGLDPNRTTLIGVVGAGKASRGLIRLRNGSIVTVRIGDRIDGGQITAIGDGAVTYAVGGRPRQLKILNER